MGNPARGPRSRSGLPRGALWGVLLMLGAPWGTARAADKAKGNGNPYISAATRLYQAFEYEDALRALDKAAQWPDNKPEDDVFIALLEGILRFETHQDDKGLSAFRRALAIDPDARSPFPLAPKVAAQLEGVREEIRKSKVTSKSPEVPVTPDPKPQPPAVPETPKGDSLVGSSSLAQGLSRYRLPIAIGGGAVALGGALSWGRAKSLEQRLRSVDPSITTRDQLNGALREGRTFESIGWVLLGVGAATAVGSLLLLDAPSSTPSVAAAPTPGGAHVSLNWSLP